MDGVETCVVHPNTSYCRACRSISGGKEVLIQCPDCEEWHCRQDLAWCNGRPLPQSLDKTHPQTADATPKKEQKNSAQPQHGPKPEPCKSCLDSDDDELLPFMTCSSGYSCWSYGHKVCDDCSPDGGMECSKGHKWYCDHCASAKGFSGVWECPHCETLFCHSCEGIDRCIECGASTLCEQCKKDEESSEEDPAGTCLNWECAGCAGKMCTACVTKGLAKTCQSCDKDVCEDCAGVDECSQCGASMCQNCRDDQCMQCDGFSELKGRELAQEMEYDMYDMYDDYDGDDYYF